MSDNLLNSNKDENTSKNTAEEIKAPLNDDIGSNVTEMADNGDDGVAEHSTSETNTELESSELNNSEDEGSASEAPDGESSDDADEQTSVTATVADIEQTFDWDPETTAAERKKKIKKEKKERKKNRSVSIRIFAVAMVAAIIVCSTLAFRIAENRYNAQLEKAKQDIYSSLQDDGYDIYKYAKIIDEYFSLLEYHDYDREAAIAAMLKGYVAGTGDKYAAYYTAEEYAAQNSEDAGNMVGIGVSVIYNTDEKAIEIINVYEDAPASEAGLLPGDLITHITVDGQKLSVAEIGYEAATNKIRGEEGTYAEFSIIRDGKTDEPMDFKIQRKKVTTYSVTYHVCATDAKIGIVKISSFDFTTPSQFTEAVDDLISKGCEKFVLDVRYNPGGLLVSVEAVLSYFLNEGDNIIYTENALGTGTWSKAEVINYKNEPYSMCNVSKNDIGKYKDLDVIVLANESTASAGELFTATLKEYGIAKVVGVTTFGKGTMQTTYSLERYGLEGAVKMTTHMYTPKSQQSYDGIGISPDYIEPLDEALKDKNIYKITDAEDNQLQKAISVLYGN